MLWVEYLVADQVSSRRNNRLISNAGPCLMNGFVTRFVRLDAVDAHVTLVLASGHVRCASAGACVVAVVLDVRWLAVCGVECGGISVTPPIYLDATVQISRGHC